ncbi:MULTISPECIES: HdeD family acid-resistance protein [Actinomadura]|uniref:HdeD family acid-resistance protein n=1 Tax=Actinomadura miaoliensis TaxID=430685 RepID=A0ABP7W8Q2_9ACTN
MDDLLARGWWTLALRGAVAILFGLIAWIWPGITVLTLVLLFGAYALVDGVGSLVAAARGVPGESRAWLGVAGVCGIVLGIVALVWPGITGLALLFLIAVWALVTGVLEIVAAIRLRHVIRGEWLYALSGAVSVLFGVLLLVWPVSGALAVVWMIGFFSIVFGAAMVGAAFRLRRLAREMTRPGMRPGGASPAHP